MGQDSTNTNANGIELFAGEAWFDPIEAGIRERVREFIEELLEQPCCTEQTCGRSCPSPGCCSSDADEDQASQFQHAVERMDGDVHLGRPTPIRARAQPVADDQLEPADGRFGPGPLRVAGRFLPSGSPVFGDAVWPVSASKPMRSLRGDRRILVPCFSSSHSPAPQSFRPVLSTRRCRGSPSLRGRGRGTSSVSARRHRVEWSGTARSSPSRPMTEPIRPSVWRSARRNTAPSVSAVSIARDKYQGWPPGVVRCSARQPSMASSVNQTVKLPRWRKLVSYSRQFVILCFCLGMCRRRCWFSLNGKVGFQGQVRGELPMLSQF